MQSDLDVPMLLIEVGALLFGLSLLSRLARRLAISPIPLYLLVGLAFGSGGLLPLSDSEEFFKVGAQIGVVLLLVMLGLEYTATELVGNLRRHTPAGLADAVLNTLPGAGFALLLGWGPVAAVAVAGITWISSSGVIAKLLGDLQRVGNRETPVIISILVIEDLAMAFYLPVLAALVVGAGLLAGATTLVVAVGAVLAVLVLALRFGNLVSALIAAKEAEALLLGVLGLTLLVAGLAERVHVSAAVGAFLVGIAISGPVAAHATRLLSPLRDLFAAAFFVFFGLATDPTEIPPVLLPALVLAALTTVTKVMTGWYAAGRIGIGIGGRWRAGLGLVPRGEFSVVIAGLAVAAGVEPQLAPFATAYVLITVIAGTLLSRLPDSAGFKRALRRSGRDAAPSDATL
ncbi:MAG: cation:proton antiporter [Micromonosporaceae bacterium]|nr:cation:proton antiporter [Micromonosporaceae bacterium]